MTEKATDAIAPYPEDFDPTRAEEILERIRHVPAVSERLNIVSGQFLGSPYIVHPLVGSADTPEVFTISLTGFDCVTYVETVLALALSDTVPQFIDTVRHLRYQGGRVGWRTRNHYMIDWIAHNVRQGFIVNLSEGRGTVNKTRVLSTIPDLPSRSVTFRCFRKRAFPRIEDRIADGDVIFFVSTRKTLDVFHTGLLFRGRGGLILRHASRRHGGVVEQPLETFLQQHSMSGFILVRPRKPSRGE
ncbi:MAG: DUF1460 domain-containing protein [Acidobacteria bacterium]|nr:MAG: DUF1460 domain-containing protein [Acidobacteriota bacterium]